jgi:hypothetical protein
MAKTMKRPIILAALICLAAKPTHAQPSEYGDMTDAQVKAIQMTSLAMLAGSHGNCPNFHVIATALSEEWYEAHVFVDRPKFKNAMTFSTLGPLEQMRKDPVEFCRGAWELLGPNGLYRRQLLEANWRRRLFFNMKKSAKPNEVLGRRPNKPGSLRER